MPWVSVIIPTYNRAAYLAGAVQSVLDQTFQDLEIIVVDDGSTDETPAVMASFRRAVRYLRQDHSGLIGALRNRGIQEATGTFIAFLDSDDLWLPDKLERQVAYAERHREFGMVYSDGWFFDDRTGRDQCRMHDHVSAASGWIGPLLLQQCFIQTPGVLLRRAILEETGLFAEDSDMNVAEDWELWLRIAARHQIGYVDQPLFRVRLHAGSHSRMDPWTSHQLNLALIERACAHAPDVYVPNKQEAVVRQYYRTIELLVADDSVEEARTLFTRAMHADPAVLVRIFRDLKRIKGGSSAPVIR
jgi:glycosyltransferase involved in cell wall biosynthesis